MVIRDLVSLELDKVFLLASFLVYICLTEYDRHLFSIEDHGSVSLLYAFATLDESERELLLWSLILLQIDF